MQCQLCADQSRLADFDLTENGQRVGTLSTCRQAPLALCQQSAPAAYTGPCSGRVLCGLLTAARCGRGPVSSQAPEPSPSGGKQSAAEAAAADAGGSCEPGAPCGTVSCWCSRAHHPPIAASPHQNNFAIAHCSSDPGLRPE